MRLPEPSDICLMLLAGCLQRDPTPTHDLHSGKRQANTPASLYYRKTSWKNLKNKEPPRIVTDDNVKMIIYCFGYLEHLQDLKTQSLLAVQDYTTTMQDCLRMLLKLNRFFITCFRFSANPIAQLSSPSNKAILCTKKSNNTCHSLQRSIHFLTSLLVETLKERRKGNMGIIKMLNVFTLLLNSL